jgi:3,4-dihydroxy 2-butanone 4-phosphate synthase/GTP cyclohydrolase II
MIMGLATMDHANDESVPPPPKAHARPRARGASFDVAAKAVDASLSAFKLGNMVLLIDDKDEQSQCNLAVSAELITPQQMAFLIRHSAGIINACCERERLEGFGLHPASSASSTSNTVYVSTNYLPGVTNGASAKDRAATLKALCDTSNPSAAFCKPGHVVPLATLSGGVLDAQRHAEACYDLCRCSDLQPVGVLAELMHEDGTMYSRKDAYRFSEMHSIPVVSVEQLTAYRQSSRKHSPAGAVQLDSQSLMWIDDIEAECTMRVYRSSDPKIEIVTIAKGDLKDAEAVPARVHSECFTGDILGSKRCDCGQQLHKFLGIMNGEEKGVLLYIRGHEGRGIGLASKIKAYRLQDQGWDTVDANLQLGLPVDTRSYADALAVFLDLGLKSIRLFTNNPDKMSSLTSITHSVAALASVSRHPSGQKYLDTKASRLNHRTILDTFKLPEMKQDVTKIKIGVVYTTWNSFYVDELLKEAVQTLEKCGAIIVKMAVPGACELISGARAMVRKHTPNSVITLGVLIRGSSDVYDVTCNSVMTGLADLNARQDVPITVGLLMCRDEDQAHERSHGGQNPAKAWAETALHMAAISMDGDFSRCVSNTSG